MQLNIIWSFLVCHALVAVSADHARSRRDLARLQNLFSWLLGLNERNILVNVPFTENNRQEEFPFTRREISYTQFKPRYKISEDLIRNYFVEHPHFRHNIAYPIAYKNCPPTVMQEYIQNRRQINCFRYVSPEFTHTNKFPISNVKSLHQIYRNPSERFTDTMHPLSQHPLYIQNIMPEVMPIPQTPQIKVSSLPNSQPMNIIKYPLQKHTEIEEKRVKFEAIPTEISPIKGVQATTFKSPLKIISDDAKTEATLHNGMNSNKRKKINFKSPLRSRYSYKMIYHNQPEKNTVIKMDNDILQPVASSKDKLALEHLLPIVKRRANGIHESTSLADFEENLPSDKLYVPPIHSNKTLPNDINNKKNILPQKIDMNHIKRAHEMANINKSNKVLSLNNTECKDKSVPVNGRGDIPDLPLRCL